MLPNDLSGVSELHFSLELLVFLGKEIRHQHMKLGLYLGWLEVGSEWVEMGQPSHV